MAQLVACQIVVSGHISKNAGQSTGAVRIVIRHRDVVLAVLRRRPAIVAAGLTDDSVAQLG
jgi:hypothetical protein